MNRIKNIYGVITFVVLLVGGYVVVTQTPKDNDSKLTPVKIAYNTESVANASIIVAYEKGYFQKHGISPQMIALKGGREVMQALVAGQADVGIGGFTNFMPAMARNAPIRFIAASVSSPSYIFVRPNEGVKTFTDLYGKIVSVTSGGINDLIFRTAMEQENVDTKKMKFFDVERAYQVVALIDKKAIDAIIVSEQDTDVLIKAGAIVLPEWESKEYAKQTEPRNAIVARSEFLNQTESATERFLDALIDAHRLIRNAPMEAAEVLANHIKDGSGGAIVHLPEKIVSQWENSEIVNMIWQNPTATMRLAKKAKDIGTIDRVLTLNEVYDLRFKDKLEIAQKEIYGDAN
jgi:ABC-type nitrate/sulfonate/bicarbonate transport system substrate-binding protein